MTVTAVKRTPAEMAAYIAELEAKMATSDAKIAQLTAAKGVGRAAPVVPADKMAPEGTPLGTIHRASRQYQAELLAKMGRLASPEDMCAWGLELTERVAKSSGKTVKELIATAFEVKSRERKPATVVDDQTKTK